MYWRQQKPPDVARIEDNRNRQMLHVLKTTETARCFTYWRQQKPPDVARTEHNTNNKMLRELFVCLFDGA